MAEPEAAGAVDVAALRRAHWSFASIARPGDANTYVCVLCNEPYPCATSRALDELTHSRARAERLEAALRLVQWGDVRWIEPADHTKGVGEWCPWCQIEKNAGHARDCIVRAALAGDAPGPGEG